MLERLHLSQDYSLIEIKPPQSLIGKGVEACEPYQVIVVLILRGDELIVNPDPNTQFLAGRYPGAGGREAAPGGVQQPGMSTSRSIRSPRRQITGFAPPAAHDPHQQDARDRQARARSRLPYSWCWD